MLGNIKILCTLGPASLHHKVIERLDDLGVDIFRINLSHITLKDLEYTIVKIKQSTTKPICLDTEGAQIRSRQVENNRIFLEDNSLVEITGEDVIGNSERISISPGYVIEEIEVGDLISIDFNTVVLHFVEKRKGSLRARVVSGGHVGSNKAVTIDRHIYLHDLTEKDKSAIEIGLKYGIKTFALSFAGSREAIETLRSYVGYDAHIISKIESRGGVKNIEDILSVTDDILIDRGDLSREESIEKIPFLQKLIIKKANSKKVPVYVATNLLESMVGSKKPTRAEVNDVVNTLLDGADGLVLAAETAIGKYPIDCVTMISAIINQYSHAYKGYSFESLENNCSYILPAPHGGRLVDRVNNTPDYDRIQNLPCLKVDKAILMDLEQIAIGTFSPLQGFMRKEELDSVLSDYRLPNGILWSLPILLQVSKDEALRFREGQTICLALRETEEIYGTLRIEEIYHINLDEVSKKTFGTNDMSHPGVIQFKQRGDYLLAGPVEFVKRVANEYKKYELTPRQTRIIFENKGWSKVVGFHTRNVIHRAHEMLQMMALEQNNCDGLFVHPVVGLKKNGDYSANVILKSYELMVEKYYPKSKVILGAFSTYSRYAGPREAIFTALCRKNFGCSHFIVGRDHTGVKSYYGPQEVHNLFSNLGDIGITPVFFESVYFCKQCNRYVENCIHHNRNALHISGTKARGILSSGEHPPDWFMRKEISQLVLNEMSNGREVFVK